MKLYNFLKTTLHFFIGKKALPASLQKGTIKFSALVTSIKGLVGNTVFSSVKSGAVIQNNIGTSARAKGATFTGAAHGAFGHNQGWQFNKRVAQPGFLNPDGSQEPNPKNLATKQNLRSVSKAWATLSDSDRAQWNQVAQDNPVNNRMGDKYTGSGYQAFMKYNLNLLTVGISARQIPACTIVKVIDDAAQEEMTCMVCDGQVVWCVYSNDMTDASSPSGRIRMQTKCNGNPDAYMLIYSSLPMSPGRSRANTMQLIAVIKPVEGYNNFLLRPTFNAVFGKNISGCNFQYKTVSMSPGGAQTIVSSGIFYLPPTTATNKISYTLDALDFIWEVNNSTIDFGSTVHAGPGVSKTILIYGIELPVSTNYTIAFVAPTSASFHLYYGSQATPLDPLTQITDIYGSIPPIPLILTFVPGTVGLKTGKVRITCAAYTFDINLRGTAT